MSRRTGAQKRRDLEAVRQANKARATATIGDQVIVTYPAQHTGRMICAQDQAGDWHQLLPGPGGKTYTCRIDAPPPWAVIATPAARWRRMLLTIARFPRRCLRAILPAR
jgi:hypothetical protein